MLGYAIANSTYAAYVVFVCMLCRVHLGSSQYNQYVISVKYGYTTDQNFYAISNVVYIT